MPVVLLVEDNVSSVSLLEDIFRFDRIPAELACATSGEEALRLAATLCPALILMDLRLPGIDGLETTEMLKHNPLTKNIPVWAITAYAMPGDEAKARLAGCEHYFVKPIPRRLLIERLQAFLRESDNTESWKNASGQNTDR